MRPRKLLLAGPLLLAALWLPTASGQGRYGKRLEDLISRPGTQGPSTSVGGRYTSEATQPLMSTRGTNVALFSQRNLPFRGGTAWGQYSRVMPLAQLGLRDTFANPERGSAVPQVQYDWELGRISGLNYAISLGLPLPGYPIGGVPALNACVYTPRPETTRFDDILGLTPARPPTEGPVSQSIAQGLEKRTEERTRLVEQLAIELFKAATTETRDPITGQYEKCRDCPDKLSEATWRLRMVADLDRKAGLPLLLLAHAALEQDRPLQAAEYLLRAVQRDPEIFLATAGEVLEQYFGDVSAAGGRSACLQSQMRRYARIGEFNPGSAASQALQGYCAWRLGEIRSARDSLQRAEELLRTSARETEALYSFTAALRSAIDRSS